MSYHRQSTKQDFEERAAFVKNKARFEDVVVMLGLVDKGAQFAKDKRPSADCPKCRGGDCLKPCHGGQGYYCEECGDKGDMIGLVCIRRDVERRTAIKMLEEALTAKRDGKTGDLFSGNRD